MTKRLLTYAVVISTVVWSVGLLAMPFSVGAAVSGDLVKKAGSPAVFYLGADSKLHTFTSSADYFTWYSDFSGVVTISDTEFSGYQLGSNVFPKPGVKLVQVVDGETPWNIFSPTVYAIAGNGTARPIGSAEAAVELYGANWESMIIPVVTSVFSQYKAGETINSASDFDKEAEMEDAATINDDLNLTLGGGSGVSTGTSLTVALASDTPASGLLLGNTINNRMTKVNLTASADGDIVIDQLVVKRGGTVASDGPFSSIALIDAGTNTRIGNTKTLNSEHKAVFNQDITIPAGTTKTIYLAGNLGATAAYAGEIPSLDLDSVTLSGSAAVIGSLPIVGHYQNINGTITVGTLTVHKGSNQPDASTQKIGVTNYIVSGVKLSANSTEDFKVTQITWDEGGTAGDSDVANLDLLVDDAVVATVAQPSDGKVTFNLSANPIVIQKGRSVQVDLQLDILDGSDRTIRFDIEDESDIYARGELYGAEVKVAASSDAEVVADATPFYTAKITTIDRGALRISTATLSATNIPEDATQILLGKFEFEAKGEPVEITSLPIAFTVTTSTGDLSTDSAVDITAVTVYDENGKVVAGPIDPVSKVSAYGGNNAVELLVATTTDSITVPAGKHIYSVKADIDSDFGTNDTIVVRINPGQVTAKGESTGLSVSPTPSTDQSSAVMTVQSAALSISISSTPVAQNVVAGSKDFVFANVVLGAQSSGEDIKVTKIKVQVDAVASASPSEVSNWSIFDGSTELSVTNDPDSDTSTKTTAASDATSTFTFTTPLVIPKGTSKTLTIKGDVSSSATNNGTIRVGIEDQTSETITAKGKDTDLDAALTVSESAGQTMTIKSTGGLTITRDSSAPKAGLLPANSQGLTVGVFSASATNEDVNIEKLYLTAVQANGGGLDQINKLYLYNGSTLLAEVEPTSTDGVDRTVLFDVTNNPIVVAKDSSTKLTLKADTAAADYERALGTGSSGEGLWLKIAATSDITAKGAQSGTTITSKDITNASTTAQYVFRSVPTVTPNENLASPVNGGTLSTKTNEPVYKFSVTASSAGPVALYRVQFLVTTSTATTTNYKLTDGTEDVAATSTGIILTTGTGNGSQIVEFLMTSDGLAPASGGTNVQPYVIATGQTRTFVVRADLECNSLNCAASSGATGGSISWQMLGDTALPSTMPASAMALDDEMYESSFIWGDLWRTSVLEVSSTTASSSAQWSNGYLVAEADGGKLAATSTAVTFTK